MYFYLGFLRPPPISVGPSAKGVVITPQIANDLRTELKDDSPTEIYYAWQRCAPKSRERTAFRKLTTYLPPGSTYTAVTVPMPDDVHSGEGWRLGLSCSKEGCRQILPLESTRVVDVWSEPIRVDPTIVTATAAGTDARHPAKRRKKIDTAAAKDRRHMPEKQTRVTREWMLESERQGEGSGSGSGSSTSSVPPVLRIVEQTSFDLDKKIWDSGLAVSSLLHSHLAGPSPSTGSSHLLLADTLECLTNVSTVSRDAETNNRPTRILEIGAGTGLVSIALAAGIGRMAARQLSKRTKDMSEGVATDNGREKGAANVETDECAGGVDHETAASGPMWKIITTDLDTAIPLIEENIALNRHLWDDEPGRTTVDIVPAVLDWDADVPEWVWEDGEGLDLVIAADVTYNTASFPALLRTLLALLNRPVSAHTPERPPPRLLLAYKQRDLAERELWDSLAQGGVEMTKVEVVRGHEAEGEEGAVEIWVGQMRKGG